MELLSLFLMIDGRNALGNIIPFAFQKAFYILLMYLLHHTLADMSALK